MKGYVIRENGEHKPIDFENTLDCLHDVIGGLIDITRRNIGEEGKEYLIVCDDEGLLKECKITAIRDGKPALVGNLLIVNQGDVEDFSSLTEDDVTYIRNSVSVVLTNGPDGMSLQSVVRLA